MTNLETTEHEASAPTPTQLRAAMVPQASLHDAAQLALGLLWMSPQTDQRARCRPWFSNEQLERLRGGTAICEGVF